MRILAIRGENLASLRQFDLDLDDADGLGAVGLFAITGPTGAGKSTLLDALCLALYDKTPRFDSNRSGHRVGRDPADPTNLGAGDVRNILRRGAGAGFAEVDFVGRDTGRYRARWSVHRARNRPGNRMQSQSMQLTDLYEDRPMGGATKSETLAVIEDLMGLSFDQFRRSVLLAQGDFDAFLRAPVKDRGALLECMTGTDIYRRLSMAAHDRHRDARAALQRLDDRLDAHPVFSPVQRARLLKQGVTDEHWADAARSREVEADRAVRWHEVDATLDAALVVARTDEADARIANDAAAVARDRLTRIRQAQPIKPLVDAATRAEADAIRRGTQVGTSSAAALEARAIAKDARAALDQAQTGYSTARASEQAAAADLRAARTLDVKVDGATTACAEADVHFAKVRQEQADLTIAITALRETRTQAEAAAAQATAAQSDADDLSALMPRWAEICADVDRWCAARATVTERLAQVTVAVGQAQEHATTLSAAKAGCDTAQHARAQADAAVSAAEQAVKQTNGAQAQSIRQRHADAAHHLEQLRDAAEHATRLTKNKADAKLRVQAAKARQTSKRSAQTKADRRETQARQALALARKALDLSRAASAVADHRAHLVAGDPCPVCGATEHPGIDPALIATSEFQTQVNALEAEVEAASDRAEQARVDLSAIGATLEAEALAQSRLLKERSALHDSWTMLRMQIGGAVPDRPDADDALALVKAQLAQARAGRDVAAKQLDSASAGLKRLAAAQTARQGAQATLTTARARVDQAQQRLQDAQGVVTDLRAAHADAAAAASRADGRISALIESVGRAQFEADPGAARATIEARITAYQAAKQAQTAALSTLTQSDARWARLQADSDALHTRTGRLTTTHADLRDRCRMLQAQRAALIDGEDADIVAERLAAATRASEIHLTAARAASEATDRAATRSAETARLAQEAGVEARLAQVEAQDRLVRACTAAQLALDAVAEWTRYDATWITAEAARLDACSAAVASAKAVQRQRAADLKAHRGHPVAALDRAVAAAAHQRATDQRRAFEAAQTTAKAQLTADDAACAARIETESERTDAEAERQLWGQLDMLIGSADGAAFREFAQSLTLDAVIARANHHLLTLSKRYALMRVPGENLALQVIDQHMGDEVRTVKSLSGGETFLVSLALALGLASLSARDTRIESLFIDEGFGTLDTDTLDVVLDALDALQAGGRQIGLISHVPGLAQRIGVQVLVEPTASGLSAVTVSTGW